MCECLCEINLDFLQRPVKKMIRYIRNVDPSMYVAPVKSDQELSLISLVVEMVNKNKIGQGLTPVPYCNSKSLQRP